MTASSLQAGPIVLDVVGEPASQGDKSAIIRGGKPRLIEGKSNAARAKLSDWRAGVRDAARQAMAKLGRPPIDEPVRVTITFRFAPTASDPYRTLHVTKPDLDKIVRSTFDALTAGGLLRDDSRVFSLWAEKRYCGAGETAGATIEVEPLGWYEARRRVEMKAAAALLRRAGRRAS